MSGPLSDTMQGPQKLMTLEEDFAALIRACPTTPQSREIRILEAYYGLKGEARLTLEAIGGQIGLTRERIRQLRDRTLKRLSAGLKLMCPRALSLVRELVADRGGMCELRWVASEIQSVLAPTEYSAETFLRWLIALRGDPALHVIKDIVMGPPVEIHQVERARLAFRHLLDQNAGATSARLCDSLAEIWPEADPVLMAHYATCVALLDGREVLPGLFARRQWTRADWAEFVLEQRGAPLHFREIARKVNQLSGGKFDETGFNTVLNTYPAFVRVGAGDFSLSKWGAMRYGRFDEVIAAYLTAEGRAVHERRIKDDLLKVYTVKESTVTAMLQWFPEKFVCFGGGYWAVVGRAPGFETDVEDELERHLRGLGRAATLHELAERVLGQTAYASDRLEPVRRTLFLSDRFRLVGSYGNPKFVLAADVKASPEEDAVDLAVRVLRDFKHPMAIGELVARISQRFFGGRYAPGVDNLQLRLSANSDVEIIGGLYRAKGKRIFS